MTAGGASAAARRGASRARMLEPRASCMLEPPAKIMMRNSRSYRLACSALCIAPPCAGPAQPARRRVSRRLQLRAQPALARAHAAACSSRPRLLRTRMGLPGRIPALAVGGGRRTPHSDAAAPRLHTPSTVPRPHPHPRLQYPANHPLPCFTPSAFTRRTLSQRAMTSIWSGPKPWSRPLTAR